jgi:hypothetical protein
VQPQFLLQWTPTGFEQFLAEFYTILLGDYFQVALDMLEMRIGSSLQSPNNQNSSLMFICGDCADQRKC